MKIIHVLSICFSSRWGQVYILDSLMNFVPQTHQDADILADRISVRLQHANSAVVLTSIKVLLYLMNYMESNRQKEALCKKMGPPLGKRSLFGIREAIGLLTIVTPSHITIFWPRGTVCGTPKYPPHHSKTADGPSERRQSLLLQVQRSRLCQTRQARDHVPTCKYRQCQDCARRAC